VIHFYYREHGERHTIGTFEVQPACAMPARCTGPVARTGALAKVIDSARSPEMARVDALNAQCMPNRVQSGCTEGPSDGELERAIVVAVTAGSLDVARTLAAVLDDGRRPRMGNAVELDPTKRRGGR
jgi:hypothetical protein